METDEQQKNQNMTLKRKHSNTDDDNFCVERPSKRQRYSERNLQITPLGTFSAQSVSTLSLITTHEVGVLNVQRCKKIQSSIDGFMVPKTPTNFTPFGGRHKVVVKQPKRQPHHKKNKKERIPQTKTKKERISLAMKKAVWGKYVGFDVGEIGCFCCNQPILQMSFSAGHIVPAAKGGIMHVDNLIPLCVSCNSSIGTKNMNDFIPMLRSKKI